MLHFKRSFKIHLIISVFSKTTTLYSYFFGLNCHNLFSAKVFFIFESYCWKKIGEKKKNLTKTVNHKTAVSLSFTLFPVEIFLPVIICWPHRPRAQWRIQTHAASFQSCKTTLGGGSLCNLL